MYPVRSCSGGPPCSSVVRRRDAPAFAPRRDGHPVRENLTLASRDIEGSEPFVLQRENATARPLNSRITKTGDPWEMRQKSCCPSSTNLGHTTGTRSRSVRGERSLAISSKSLGAAMVSGDRHHQELVLLQEGHFQGQGDKRAAHWCRSCFTDLAITLPGTVRAEALRDRRRPRSGPTLPGGGPRHRRGQNAGQERFVGQAPREIVSSGLRWIRSRPPDRLRPRFVGAEDAGWSTFGVLDMSIRHGETQVPPSAHCPVPVANQAEKS